MNRLSTATESGSGGWYEDFNYDQFGNMWVSSSSSNLSISGTTPTTSSFYNTANNHFTAVNYDNAGNQTSKLYPTTSTFAYDAESRQNSTYSNTNGTSTYAYSGDGHRVTKVALGATTTYVYDALGRMAAEYSTAEGVPDCTTCYIIDDHLGDTRLVLDESANVVSRHDYQPFGAEVPDVNGRTSLWGATDAVNQKFTGKERDLETNFDYFGARYYGYLQGRFTSPDWAAKAEAIPYAELSNPQSLNLYGYVKNNPLTKADPDGHEECGCIPWYGWTTPSRASFLADQVIGGVKQAAANFSSDWNSATVVLTTAAVIVYAEITKPTAKSDENPATSPVPLPSGLGDRHLSGPLDPAHGGTGNPVKDFDTLTGGKNGPAPEGSRYPPGTQVGDNGVASRPAIGNSGPRIDIPANGDKPHETLHYPKAQQ